VDTSGQGEGPMNTYCEKAVNAAEPSRSFAFALRQLELGRAVFRHGWNGKGMYLALQRPDRGSKMSLPYLFMRTAQNELIPWVASHSDLLANDWEVFK
jgi:hypothetical protein